MDHRSKLGKMGEDLVARRLTSMGMEIIARNYSCRPHGELDIVARFGGTILFVEVKSRVGEAGLLQAVHSRQIGRLKKMARLFLARTRRWEENYRFWGIIVLFSGIDDTDPLVISFEDAFS